jgi:hypothetical protein
VTEFPVARRQGLLVGGAAALVILLVDALCVYFIRSWPISLLTFAFNLVVIGSVPLLILLGYWLWGLATARYALDRNQLVIRWGPTHQVVPLEAIERAVDGVEAAGRPRLRAIRWPGYFAGPGELPEYGLTLFYATAPLHRQVLLVTPGVTYAISPADKEGFLEAFNIRHRMGPTQAVEQQSLIPAWLQWPLWRDRAAAVLLLAGILINLALFAYLSYRHAGLPSSIPLHFDTTGAVDRAGHPDEIFFLPFIGLTVWLLNGLLGGAVYLRVRESAAAYLLWGGSDLMQLLLWTAVVALLSTSYVPGP